MKLDCLGRTRVVSVTILSSFLLMPGAGAKQATPAAPTPCVLSGADEALTRGDLMQAESAYGALQNTAPPPKCAIHGIRKVQAAEGSLLEAVGLELAGLDDVAKATLSAVGNTYPGADYTLFLGNAYRDVKDPILAVRTAVALKALGFEVAADRLLITTASKLQVPKGFSNPLQDVDGAGPFAAAVLLERLGLHGEALAEFKKAFTSDPRTAAVALSAEQKPKELDTLLEEARHENPPRGWATFTRNVGPWARTIGEIALILLLALSLIRIVRTSLRSPTEIRDFDESEIDGVKAAKDLTALVRAAVDGLSSDLPAYSLNVVAALEASPTLPASIASDIPQAKFLAAIVDLLQKVLPERGWVVYGQLLAKSSRGVGLALRLTDARGRVKAEVALWDSDYRGTLGDDKGDATAYDRLDLPAGVWIAYHVIGIIWREKRSYVTHPIARKRLGDRLGSLPTKDWRSYAFFASGSKLHTVDKDAAIELYNKALRQDPRNAAALFNRAVLDIKSEAWDLAEDRLDRLKRWLDTEPDRREDFLWYRYKYMAAVLQMNRELTRAAGGRVSLEPFEQAKEHLTSSLTALEEKLDQFAGKSSRYRFPSDRSRSRALLQGLTDFEGAFVYALAGVVARLEAASSTGELPGEAS
jgi:tetratricopeptide (TPR) repeat protein